MINKILGGVGSFLGNFGENAALGSSIGGAFGPIGGLIGGGVGLISDLLNNDEEELLKLMRKRESNLKQYGENRSVTQALRADWVANSNPVMAAKDGGETPVLAMVAPGEVIVTEDGRVVHVKGNGNEDNVPWTGGPATVFGNLKMPGTDKKFKDFAKAHYRETKENSNIAAGTLKAQAATAKILSNMLKNVQQQQNVKPKTATVTYKNLKNIKNAKVPAAEVGIDYNTLLQQSLDVMEKAAATSQQTIDQLNEANIRTSLVKVTPVKTTTPIIVEKKSNWKNMLNSFANAVPTIGQMAMLYGNARENNMAPDQVPVNYNRLTPAAIRLGYSNTYDLLGSLNDVNNLNRTMTYNANTLGNSSGVNAMLKIAAHTKSLDAMRNVRRDFSIAQAEANRALGDFLYKAGAEDVVAENYQQDLQARNNAAAYNAKQTVRRDIAKAYAQIGKDVKGNANNDALLALLQPYLTPGLDQVTLDNVLNKLKA